jgi:dihydropteroate synthase
MESPFRLMGVVNATPDSFSDGGLFLEPAAAIAHGLALAAQGADIVDVGGESTRPGAEPVAAEEELRRVLPVVEGLAEAWAYGSEGESRSARPQISIDTSKAAVARAALAAGAGLVNDVTALRGDSEMAAVVAQSGAECCLMHMLGEPRTMQGPIGAGRPGGGGVGGPKYNDVVDDVKAFLSERLEFAVRAGVAEKRVLLDPGIGFGKTVGHNLQLLRRLDELTALGRPLLVGTSRKSFIGKVLVAAGLDAGLGLGVGSGPGMRPGPAPDASEAARTEGRLAGTLATCVLAYERGARVFRVHDVAPTRAALAVAAATLDATWAARSQTSSRAS